MNVGYKCSSPRVLKTHCDFEDYPIDNKCKYIYIVRNNKHFIVIYYNHIKNLSFYQYNDGSFDDFFLIIF
uniref:Sulfotransfer_1 domain-containing protein n=1 Tax=Strongyloides papillosus TaxID=174720 RepID=A0A0N5BJ18_STREA